MRKIFSLVAFFVLTLSNKIIEINDNLLASGQ
jgi:hypothetical protein